MSQDDKTRQVLTDALAELFRQQTNRTRAKPNGNFLVGGDGKFLGRVTKDRHDQTSLLNKFGPHGSKYSQTSIFNPHSPYASRHGSFSMNNPHSTKPPRLMLGDQFTKFVTVNKRLKNALDPEVFISLLKGDLDLLLRGDFESSIPQFSCANSDMYILAADGRNLGSLATNAFDQTSLFNTFCPYGNPYNSTSLFNEFGPYGNPFSQLSAFNEFTATPPRIFSRSQNQALAYLTKNRLLTPRVDPDLLRVFADRHAS